eukprot:COSAG02_NODE_1325_length_13237_cov_5.436901_7_plen_95_part_00
MGRRRGTPAYLMWPSTPQISRQPPAPPTQPRAAHAWQLQLCLNLGEALAGAQPPRAPAPRPPAASLHVLYLRRLPRRMTISGDLGACRFNFVIL